MIQPPVIGPTIGATTVTIAIKANAAPRFIEGKIASNNVWHMGNIGPAKKPCNALKVINSGMLVAIPHKKEVSVNSETEIINNFSSPIRRESHPVSGNAIALHTAKRSNDPGTLL